MEVAVKGIGSDHRVRGMQEGRAGAAGRREGRGGAGGGVAGVEAVDMDCEGDVHGGLCGGGRGG